MARTPKNINTKVLEDLTLSVFNSYRYDYETKDKIRAIKDMLIFDPVTSLAYETICLMIINMIGAYINEDDQQVADECNESLADMQGTFKHKLLNACSIMPYGFAYAQLMYKVKGGYATLKGVDFLDQERVRFDGTTRDLKVFYQGEHKEVELIYDQGFHIKNQSNIDPSDKPTGYRCGDRALPDWNLHKLFFSSYGVVGQKQATKLLLGKTDTTAEVGTGTFDVDGNEILMAGNEVMLATLEGAENSSVIVVDVNDEVESVDQSSDGKFFMDAFTRLDNNRFRCFYVPQTHYGGNSSGVGDAGLAETQADNFISIAASKAEYICGEFVEQVLRPMNEFNHGKQKNTGHFEINTKDSKALEIAALLEKVVGGTALDTDEDSKKAALGRLASLLGY